MFQLLLILAVAANLTVSKLTHLEINELHTRVSLKKCVMEACKMFFNGDFETITYSLPMVENNKKLQSVVTMSQILLPALELEYQWTVLINGNQEHSTNTFKNFMRKSSAYVIQIRTEGEIFRIIGKLYYLSWNLQAKFLIISSTLFKRPLKIAMEVTRMLWLAKVVNVAVLLVDPRNVTRFTVYSWKPYSAESCGDNFSKTYPKSSCSFGVIDLEEPWFDNHIGKELYNCSLKAGYTIWPPFVLNLAKPIESNNDHLSQGIEVNLLNMVANSINTVIIFEESNFSSWEQIANGEIFIEDLRILENNRIDLLIGSYPKTSEICWYLECSRSYIQEILVWCVPHVTIMNNRNIIIKIFDKSVWACLICSYLSFTICIWCLSLDYQRKPKSLENLLKYCLNNFSIIIGLSVNKQPVLLRVRYFAGLLFIFSLYINITFTSTLTSFLSKPSKLEKFSSVESIYENDLDTYFLPESISHFKATDSDEDNYIRNVPIETIQRKWLNCSYPRQCLRNVGVQQKSAFCLPKLHKQYLFSHDTNIMGTQNSIYCIEDNIVSFPVNILMRKGFPLFKMFDEVIGRIVSAGFICKWVNEIVESKYSVRKDRFITEFKTIKFENLFPIFRVLILGQSVSFVIFVAEIIYHRLRSLGRKCHK